MTYNAQTWTLNSKYANIQQNALYILSVILLEHKVETLHYSPKYKPSRVAVFDEDDVTI